MQTKHTPIIDARYWAAITFASIFGTNMGDYYAHESGLGLLGGVPILIAIFAVVYFAEKFDNATHQIYYWLAIIIMRTGATNIADFLAFRVRIPMFWLNLMLSLIMAAFILRHSPIKYVGTRSTGLPETNAKYWGAMLLAGVLGTALGDACIHTFGLGIAAIGLSVVLAIALFVGKGGRLQTIYYYWLTIAVARTTGTAIGDFFAESKDLNFGLLNSTIGTGIAFVLILVLWRSKPKTT